MYDDDREALAAEYVLGTLSVEERNQAEALLLLDRGFESAVRQWERRLGELNVMVEAVEPPPELWEKIKTQIDPFEPLREVESPRVESAEPPAAAVTAALPAAALLPVPPEAEKRALAEPAAGATAETSPLVTAPRRIERGGGAEAIYLARRVRRWRRLTLAFGVLAAVLAAYIAIWQAAPELVPERLRPPGARIMAAGPSVSAPSTASARQAQDRLVAVLQHEPTDPAFLLTLDTKSRTLFVRRVTATPDAGRSYELWLVSSGLPRPHSLGIVGQEEFTQRAIPGNYDIDTLRTARYEVSLEPTGGSRSGVPTGPVLFTGKAVESLPTAPPPPAPRPAAAAPAASQK